MNDVTCPECGYTPSEDEDDLEALPGSPWIIDFELESGREIETIRCPECQSVVSRTGPWTEGGDSA